MNTQKTPLHKPCIIIFGPTGVGKSDCAERLGATMPIEIINMDMGQLYVPLTIGTAKPAWQDSPIPHHMFDVIDTPRNYTVMEYNARVIPLINEVRSRGNIPVLVGGSAFYLQSLLFPPPPNYASLPVDQALGADGTWAELNAIDSERAATIHPHDAYRINRALHIWRTTGNKPSTYVPVFNPPTDFMLIFLTRERHELYDRINKRVEIMIADGLVNECKALVGTPWEEFVHEKGIIGYPEIFDFLNNKQELSQAVGLVAQRTRHYAKRQHTFWRMVQKKLLDKEKTAQQSLVDYQVQELNLTLLDLDLYISQLSDSIQASYTSLEPYVF